MSFPSLVAVTLQWRFLEPWRMPVGLHPAKKVRRVKRPGNREMRVRTPPWECSLRTASRHSWSPRLFDRQSRRMPEGLHRLVSARSRVRAPPGPSWGPVAQLVEQECLSKTSSPRTELLKNGGNAGRDYIFVWIERRPRQFLVPLTDTKLANADGNTSVEASACGSSPQVLIIPRRWHKLGRANAGRTTWESTCESRRSAVRSRPWETG